MLYRGYVETIYSPLPYQETVSQESLPHSENQTAMKADQLGPGSEVDTPDHPSNSWGQGFRV